MPTIQQMRDVGRGCDHCSGFYLHFDDCPMVEPRKMKRDRARELIANGYEPVAAYRIAIMEERDSNLNDDRGYRSASKLRGIEGR